MGDYVFDAYLIDTTPGNIASPFSPAKDWQGDDTAYLVWLRERFKADPGLRQRLAIAVRGKSRGVDLRIIGQYTAPITRAIETFGQQQKQK